MNNCIAPKKIYAFQGKAMKIFQKCEIISFSEIRKDFKNFKKDKSTFYIYNFSFSRLLKNFQM